MKILTFEISNVQKNKKNKIGIVNERLSRNAYNVSANRTR
jgi:hypothetical protein